MALTSFPCSVSPLLSTSTSAAVSVAAAFCAAQSAMENEAKRRHAARRPAKRTVGCVDAWSIRSKPSFWGIRFPERRCHRPEQKQGSTVGCDSWDRRTLRPARAKASEKLQHRVREPARNYFRSHPKTGGKGCPKADRKLLPMRRNPSKPIL